MKLKKQFLSLSALLAMGMGATTTAWAGQVDPTVVNNNGNYSVYMPSPIGGGESVTSSWTIPDGVFSFKVYDDGGPSAPFTSITNCNDALKCSEFLQLTAPEGYFLHLTGSMESGAPGATAYFRVFNGFTTDINSRRINPEGSVNFMEAWTRNEMQLQFYTVGSGSPNGAGLDLTVEVAMDVGPDGLASYTFPSSVNHLELHASPTTNENEPTGNAFEKKTVLTAPSGSFMYLAFNDTLAEGDSVIVLNGGLNSTDTLLKKSDVNNDTVFSSSNVLTVCVKASDNGLDKILRSIAYVLSKNTELSTAGIDFYKNESSGYTIAKISDVQAGTVSIPNTIEVDSIVFNRTFKTNIKETIVLPFQLPADATTNAKFYYLRKVVQQEDVCAWKATLKRVTAPKANKPYAIVIENGTELQINLNGGKAEFKTAATVEQLDSTGNWIFKGTYEYKTWESDDEEIRLAYALAKENGDNYVAGQFVKIGENSSAAPMRAYMRKADENVRLSRPLAKGEVSSIESLPEVIDVELVDEDDKPMAIGRMNTVTGAIKINRWIDLKGRSTNHKPTTKGVFFNKKGIAK